MPTYADQLISALLIGGLQTIHGLAPGQVDALAADIVSIIGVAYAVFAANPSKMSPVAFVMSLVRKGGQGATWNAGVSGLEAQIIPIVERIVDEKIHAKAGFLAGPLDGVANAAIRDGAKSAGDHLTIS